MVWGVLVDRLLYEANINYSELGRQLGCDRAYIHKIIKGQKKPPSLEKLNKIYSIISKKIEISSNMEIDYYNTAMIEKYEKSEAMALFLYCNSLKSSA